MLAKCSSRLLQRRHQQTRQAVKRIAHRRIDHLCRQRQLLHSSTALIKNAYLANGIEKNVLGLIPPDMHAVGFTNLMTHIGRKCVTGRSIQWIACMQTPRADKFATLQYSSLRIGSTYD